MTLIKYQYDDVNRDLCRQNASDESIVLRLIRLLTKFQKTDLSQQDGTSWHTSQEKIVALRDMNFQSEAFHTTITTADPQDHDIFLCMYLN